MLQVVRPEASPQSTPNVISITPSTVTTANTPGPPITSTLATLPRIISQPSNSSTTTTQSDNGADKSNIHGSQRVGDGAVHTTLSVDTNHSGPVIEGPPTPTHSETADCTKG